MLKAGAVLTVTVELEFSLDQQGQGLESHFDNVSRRLVELFRSRQIAATWSVADPAVSSATDLIRAGHPQNEIAILGDRSWIGTGAGRERFSRELRRRLERAKCVGIPCSTLVVRQSEFGGNLDLLAPAGVDAIVRHADGGVVSSPSAELVYSGIVGVTSSLRLPMRQWWDWSHGTRKALRMLRELIARTREMHLILDAAQIAQRKGRSMHAIGRFLDRVVELRQAGHVETLTIRGFKEMRILEFERRRFHSILRPAA
jgi:hypothetical protein